MFHSYLRFQAPWNKLSSEDMARQALLPAVGLLVPGNLTCLVQECIYWGNTLKIQFPTHFMLSNLQLYQNIGESSYCMGCLCIDLSRNLEIVPCSGLGQFPSQMDGFYPFIIWKLWTCFHVFKMESARWVIAHSQLSSFSTLSAFCGEWLALPICCSSLWSQVFTKVLTLVLPLLHS